MQLVPNDYQIQFVFVAICLIIFGARIKILIIIKVKILVLITWSYKSNQSCWPLSLEWFAYFEHAVQSLLNTWCLGDVFLMYVLRSKPYHIPLKYRCPNYCYVGIRFVYLTYCLNRDVLFMLGITRWFTYVCLNGIRYLGVMWFLFHVLQLLPIRFTHKKKLNLH